MKIVVLGVTGMLGHLTGIFLKEKYGQQVVLSARTITGRIFSENDIIALDLLDDKSLKALIEKNRPCVIVNCAAVSDVQKGQQALDGMNTYLPQRIGDILDSKNDGSRLIHISTDGVFSGDRGYYSEEDAPDAEDLYGKSKRSGEITHAPHLTIRTSIIGPDPVNARGLMHWFLSQGGEVKGYSRVFWSGVTTLELAQFIDHAISRQISGVYHLCSQRISKYELLGMLAVVFAKSIPVIKDEQKRLDRSLVSLRNDGGYVVCDFPQQLVQLKNWMNNHHGLYSGILV